MKRRITDDHEVEDTKIFRNCKQCLGSRRDPDLVDDLEVHWPRMSAHTWPATWWVCGI
jgi:hypothetical protein